MHVLFWFDMMIVLEQQQRIIHWTLVSGKHILYKSACEENSLKLLHTLSCICWKVLPFIAAFQLLNKMSPSDNFTARLQGMKESRSRYQGTLQPNTVSTPSWRHSRMILPRMMVWWISVSLPYLLVLDDLFVLMIMGPSWQVMLTLHDNSETLLNW